MQDRHAEYSQIKMENELAAKMRTIMIGALDSIEKKLGPIWGCNEKRQLTQEERDLAEVYAELRTEILDKGNTQIRNIKPFLELFNLEYVGYKLEIRMPVVRKEAKQGHLDEKTYIGKKDA